MLASFNSTRGEHESGFGILVEAHGSDQTRGDFNKRVCKASRPCSQEFVLLAAQSPARSSTHQSRWPEGVRRTTVRIPANVTAAHKMALRGQILMAAVTMR